MTEETYIILIKELNDMSNKCRSLEIENVRLTTENVALNKYKFHLESEIEFIKSLIVDKSLAHPKNTMVISSENTESNYEFDLLLNDYEINRNVNILIELFDKFPDKHKYILTAIREALPENIHELAEIYQFENDLELLNKSNKIIKGLESGDQFEKTGPLELVDKYIKSYNLNNKKAAYRYLKQALITFPLTYNEQFIDRIQAYLFDDFSEKFEIFFNENQQFTVKHITKVLILVV